MNQEPDSVGEAENSGLPVNETPAPVPVFNCIVYVAQHSEGGVRARVANLADLQLKAASERDALSRIVPEFKRRVGEAMQKGEEIAWIDPPLEADEDEQQRLIPIHL